MCSPLKPVWQLYSLEEPGCWGGRRGGGGSNFWVTVHFGGVVQLCGTVISQNFWDWAEY
jgi:hypothetical protein